LNDEGQCHVPSPNSGFIAIAAGYYHSLGLKSDGSIVAWGENDDGQCDVPSPNSGFTAVAGGMDHSLGLKE
jgi:alpha-tubulin suppressor-like RCC1 family protein